MSQVSLKYYIGMCQLEIELRLYTMNNKVITTVLHCAIIFPNYQVQHNILLLSLQCYYRDGNPVHETGTYLICGHTYSFCKTHFTTEYAGYCPTCDRRKFCTWKYWICGHPNNITHPNTEYSCGHVISMSTTCYNSISDCPVYGGKDSGFQLP